MSELAAHRSQLPVAPSSFHVPRLADFRFADRSSLISPVVLAGIVRALDFAVIAGMGLGIALFYVGDLEHHDVTRYATSVAMTALIAIGFFEVMGLNRFPSTMSLPRLLPRLIAGWHLALTALVFAVFFLKIGPDFSRVWLIAWFVAGAGVLTLSRLVVWTLSHRWMRQGRLNRRAVIYGGGQACQDLLAVLEQDPNSDIRICGIFDERDDGRTPPLTAGYPKLGSLGDLVDFARRTRVDMVILALPVAAEARVLKVLEKLWVLPVDIRMAASASSLRLNRRAYSFVGKVALIDLCDKPLADWSTVAKWLFDKFVGSVAVLLLAPIMLAVAVAIRFDSRGPALFRQKRYGFNNELIKVYKFRTMYVDQTDAQADRLVARDDPRVTRIGRFLRSSSIDELPQLFNVLLGNLSLVGPRPHALKAKAAGKLYDEVVDSYFARHKVKPGITGWAQINGWRGETDTQEKIEKRIEHDLYYIENWSLLLDLYILAVTPFALLKTDNAY
jgi:Undecaprenyl-phosphate glucose phosphotransferase